MLRHLRISWVVRQAALVRLPPRIEIGVDDSTSVGCAASPVASLVASLGARTTSMYRLPPERSVVIVRPHVASAPSSRLRWPLSLCAFFGNSLSAAGSA